MIDNRLIYNLEVGEHYFENYIANMLKTSAGLFITAVLILMNVNLVQAQEPEKEKELIKVDEVFDNIKRREKKLGAKPDSAAKAIEQAKPTRKQKKEQRIKDGKMVISPYIAPAYSPELEFAISGGALVTFSTKPSDTLLTRSSVPVAFTVSSNGSKLLTSYWTTFFLSNNS